MSSSDEFPGVVPSRSDGNDTPGKPLTVGSQMIDKGAQMLQSLKPIKQVNQHVCTFAMYSHDMTRQIQTHHYVTRINQDFLQCAVYDSDSTTARLIGVEYIVSDRIFESLAAEEQKLWHSHAYEIKAGLWMNPRVPEMIQKSELQDLAKSYGKFWCTWQVDRGDVLPLGAPSLMMSPQEVNLGMLKPELLKRREDKYKVSNESLMQSRAGIEVPEKIKTNADYWKNAGKGSAIDIEQTPEMKLITPFP
ncbi:hypothetical protein C5167_039705 [Papaver somniferum]|uniref:DUF1264 domain-containing protein n=1 Tax=Papaver somniferum TaxID=3469 RepID=A0A4Y7IGC9_PAPSO|nr:oil body-associated protein 2A-like [Papaver somniferum]RZC46752.1 hypothetical protein C5167_039705 [Papaver somniferum]